MRVGKAVDRLLSGLVFVFLMYLRQRMFDSTGRRSIRMSSFVVSTLYSCSSELFRV